MSGLPKAFLSSCFLIFLFCPPAPAGQPPDPISLNQAVQLAVAANPDLASFVSKTHALADVPEQAGSLPDPQVVLKAANFPTDTFSLSQEPMTQLVVGVNQMIPFPGKLDLRQRIAELDSAAAVSDLQEKKLMLIQDVKLSWWSLFFLDKNLEIVGRNQELFRQLEQTARTKYEVGKGLQQDVLLAQLESSKLLDMVLTLENNRRNMAAGFNMLLNRATETPVVLAQPDEKELPKLDDPEELHIRAAKSRPLLDSMSQQKDQAAMQKEMAELNYYPDFMLGVSYGYRDGRNPDKSDRADFAGLSVAMNVPLFNRTSRERQVSQRNHQYRQHVYGLENAANKVSVQVETAASDYGQALDEIELLKQGIIPQAKQTLESMLAGYQVNKVDFLNLIRTQTALYNFETRYWKAYSDAHKALARLSAAMGEEINHE